MCVSGDGSGWNFEAKLGQLLTVSLSGQGLADVSLNIQAAAGLISAHHSASSIQSCTLLKVSTNTASVTVHTVSLYINVSNINATVKTCIHVGDHSQFDCATSGNKK